MRTIYLHGHLATFTPSVELEVETAAEAIRALSINFPGFTTALASGSYEVIRGKSVSTGRALELDDVKGFRLGRGDLHILPVAEGAKRGGTLKVILGTALIGAAAFGAVAALASPLLHPTMIAGLTWQNVAVMGLGMTIAGASQMMTKTDNASKSEEKDSSYTLSGALNNYEQGNPVPLVYGEVITGGQLISAGIDIEQLKN